MGFLDNLENSLKSLESEGQREDSARDRDRKHADRAAQQASAPWADRLKSSPYTQELMRAATRAGFPLRTKVYMVWAGTTLRLEARERRLELRPTADGVRAVFLVAQEEKVSRLISLDDDPSSLVEEWLRPLRDSPAASE